MTRRVREPLSLGAAALNETLAICVGRQVRAVDSNGLAHSRARFPQSAEHRVDARGQELVMRAQLAGEPVAGVHARDCAEHRPQRGVVTDQGSGARPCRQRVQTLDQHHPDHRADGVAGAAGPLQFLKLSDQRSDLGAVRKRANVCGVASGSYLGGGHEGASSGSAPGVLPALAGGTCI